MTDIQKARDVLAEWRESAITPNFWAARDHEVVVSDDGACFFGERWIADTDSTTGNARLIVGIAGNPDLLDAIDELLGATVAALEAWGNRVGRLTVDSNGRVARIAAAILAADERMSA